MYEACSRMYEVCSRMYEGGWGMYEVGWGMYEDCWRYETVDKVSSCSWQPKYYTNGKTIPRIVKTINSIRPNSVPN